MLSQAGRKRVVDLVDVRLLNKEHVMASWSSAEHNIDKAFLHQHGLRRRVHWDSKARSRVSATLYLLVSQNTRQV